MADVRAREAVTQVPEALAASDHGGAEVERPRAEVASRRTVLAGLLIVIACVLAPLSAVAVWTKNQVTNTDRYVRTMAPLASEPAIQRALADRITAKIFASVHVKGLTKQAVDALANRLAHDALVKALTGNGGGAVTIQNDTVTLNLPKT